MFSILSEYTLKTQQQQHLHNLYTPIFREYHFLFFIFYIRVISWFSYLSFFRIPVMYCLSKYLYKFKVKHWFTLYLYLFWIFSLSLIPCLYVSRLQLIQWFIQWLSPLSTSDFSFRIIFQNTYHTSPIKSLCAYISSHRIRQDPLSVFYVNGTYEIVCDSG